MNLKVSEERKQGFAVRTIRVRVPELPTEYCGYRILQLSDFHRGPATNLSHLEEAFCIVRTLKANVLLLTGDYVQNTRIGFQHVLGTKVNPKVFGWLDYRRKVRAYAEEVSCLLKAVHFPDGVFAVFGNHDYLEGLGSIIRAFPKDLEWLTNRNIKIAKGSKYIFVAGVDDVLRGKPDLRLALGNIQDEPYVFKLLLSHNPDIVLDNNSFLLESVNLVLSGHTHGGQFCLPFIGPVVTRTRQRQHVSGLSKFGNTHIYTSSGLGYGAFGVRTFCPPEITLIELCS